MLKKMLSAIKVCAKYGGTELKKVAVPEVGPDEVLIKVKVASICGTDVHIYEWNKWAEERIKIPRIYGHEFAGHIVKLGSNVANLKVGDYVSGECHIACGHCYNCRTGLAHICQNTKIFGVDVDGVFAEYVKIPAANTWKNDPELKPELASIQDPLGNAVHSVFRCNVPGQNVVVFGVGPIGMLTVAVCKAVGAAQVIAIGRRNRYRTELAKKLGADYAILSTETDVVEFVKEKTEGHGADVVLEAAGDAAAIPTCLRALRPGGELALLGVFETSTTLDLSKDVVFKYINIYGVNGRLIWDTWYRMSGLLKSGRLNVERVITHRFRFEDFETAMETMRSGQSGKIILTIGD